MKCGTQSFSFLVYFNSSAMSSSKIIQKKIRRFFNLPQKGENYEFRAGLVSKYADERKDTIQRVISAMTTGKDVSALFPLVLQNIATHDLQQKKLVYLYLMNYAKSNPELVILATNTFVIDTQDPNPLIRALAIRTMGCIRVDRMVDYMANPLKRTLEDDNPYVRKTAVICVAKLFDLNPQMCIDHGFLQKLIDLVQDPNQMVVANAIASLTELMKITQSKELFVIDEVILNKLLKTLDECSEWGKVSILKALATYEAQSTTTVNKIVEKVAPQLQHENSAVVLNSIKILIKQSPSETILKRLSAPLCSLMSQPAEIQYVALRNIRILLELYPNILDKDLRAFFVHYDDPVYLKLEKIETLVRIVNEDTALILLSELREYSMDMDQEVVSKAIMALTHLALKIPKCAKKTIEVIYELFLNRSEYIVDDCVIACENILRRFQSEYLSSVLSIVTSSDPEVSLETVESKEAMSALIWIYGSYPASMPHLETKLELMVNNFASYEPFVQTSILTTMVKISLTKPTPKTPELLQRVLEISTKQIENADVRDKAYLYWRLLSGPQNIVKSVVLAPLPPLKTLIETFTPELLNTLKDELGMLGSVYYRPGNSFEDIGNDLKGNSKVLKDKDINELSELAKKEIIGNVRSENLLDIDDDDDEEEKEYMEKGNGGSGSVLDELNDLFAGMTTTATDNNAEAHGTDSETESPNITPTATKTKKDTHADLLDLF